MADGQFLFRLSASMLSMPDDKFVGGASHLAFHVCCSIFCGGFADFLFGTVFPIGSIPGSSVLQFLMRSVCSGIAIIQNIPIHHYKTKVLLTFTNGTLTTLKGITTYL